MSLTAEEREREAEIAREQAVREIEREREYLAWEERQRWEALGRLERP